MPDFEPTSGATYCLMLLSTCAWGADYPTTLNGKPLEPPRLTLDAELDQGINSSNTLQRYNNASTTRFDATEFTGHALTSGRLTAVVPVGAPAAGHELRFEIVPLQVSGTQFPHSAIVYDGATFRPDRPLTVLYQFNTYRVTYDVPVFRSGTPAGWDFRLGGTLAIRDAQVRLKQDGLRRNFVNYGPVPLAFGSARMAVAGHWAIEADMEAFPAPGGGGLLDTSTRIVWAPATHHSLYAGVRYTAGGATQDTFFDFIHVTTALIGVRASIPR